MSTETEKAAANGEARTGDGDTSAPDANASATSASATEEAKTADPKADPTPEQKLADAAAESGRLRDQLLRTAADFDNFRKRARRSEDDASRRAREQLLKELLPVFDNLERAVQHAEGAPDVQSVASGLKMVLKQFVDTLEKSGIKRIVAVGQPFDPTRHEAIQQLNSADHPAGMVMAEVQPGYVMGEALVRPTMVVVSKGPADGGGSTSS
jgi:molecular chaperone GrpE